MIRNLLDFLINKFCDLCSQTKLHKNKFIDIKCITQNVWGFLIFYNKELSNCKYYYAFIEQNIR